MTWKNTIGHTPSELVYGNKLLFLVEFQFNTFRIVEKVGLDLSFAQQERLMQLSELDEIRQEASQHTNLV